MTGATFIAYSLPDSANSRIRRLGNLKCTYFQKAGSGMTFENKIDTHYLACMYSRKSGKYKSGRLIVSYTHSQNVPDFAFWDTSTNCLHCSDFSPNNRWQNYKDFQNCQRKDNFFLKSSHFNLCSPSSTKSR